MNNLSTGLLLVSLAFIVLSILISGLAITTTIRLRRMVSEYEVSRATEFFNLAGITERIQQRHRVRAYLRILEGDINRGKEIEIFGDTLIGRSLHYADIIFQIDDENSPLSGLHCTIIDEEDRFLVRDEDSGNGTYLNGVRLQPLVGEILVDEDEIELARVELGGVRLQFLAAQVE